MPSHYQNQCWLTGSGIVNWAIKSELQWIKIWELSWKKCLEKTLSAKWLLFKGAINSLWPSDTIWWQWCVSTLTPVMTWCCTRQAITWTNVDLLLNVFCSIHLRVIPQEMVMNFLHNKCLDYHTSEMNTTSPRVNELTYKNVIVHSLLDTRPPCDL